MAGLSGQGHPLFGTHHTSETCEKISQALKGERNPHFGKPSWNKGIPVSKEVKDKISNTTKKQFSEMGRISWMRGKKHTEKAITQLRSAHKGKHYSPQTEFKKGQIPWIKGKKLDQEQRKKLSEAHKGKGIGKDNPFYGKQHTIETKLKISKANKGQTPWNKGQWIKKTCLVCGKEFEVIPARKSEARFCSKACAAKHKFLGKPMSEEHKRNIGKATKGILKGRKLSAEHRKNISISLQGDKAPSWKGGLSFIPYCPKFNKELKEKIRERDNRTCQLCGGKENGKRLCVHHIHYDKPNCNPDLISLCNPCHTKVNSNRDYYENLFMEKLKAKGLCI